MQYYQTQGFENIPEQQIQRYLQEFQNLKKLF